MRLGIVGHEAAKFTRATERDARVAIRGLILSHGAREVCSGECPLGGVDIWAREEAQALGVPFTAYAPEVNVWDGAPLGKIGFKQRNLQIAGADLVACVVVRELPHTYRGRRFYGCYHCLDRTPPHTKSGGCWTAWRAPRREWVIL